MFCVNCGANIEDDAVFCPECGASTAEQEVTAAIDSHAAATSTVASVAEAGVFCPMCGKTVSAGSKWCGSCGSAIGGGNTAGYFAKPAKKSSGKSSKIIGVVVAAAVVVALGVAVSGSLGGKAKPILYVNDGDFMANSYKADKSVEVERSLNPEWITVSEDQKYLFYLKDGSDLCYKKMSKLDGDDERISRDVESYQVLDDNRVVFRKNDGGLYVSDLKDDELIAKDTYSGFYVNEKQTEIMWIEDDGDLYCQDLKLKKDSEKIATKVGYVERYTADLNEILYTKSNESGLYLLKDRKNEEKIVENYGTYTAFVADDKIHVYYNEVKNSDASITYYDCVTDDADSYADEYNVENDREELKDEELYYNDCEMYYYTYKDGAQSLGENTNARIYSSYYSDEPVVILRLQELPENSGFRMSDMYKNDTDVYDFCEQIEDFYDENETFYVANAAEKAEIDLETKDTDISIVGTDTDKNLVYFTYKEEDENYSDLLTVSYEKEMGETNEIERDIDWANYVDGEVFYRIDDELYCGDESIYDDATNETVISAMADSDNKIVAVYDNSYSEAELYMWNGKKLKEIEKEVYSYWVADEKHIVMILDYSSSSGVGDLYYFNGKKSVSLECEASRILVY